jgi:hypothetical protein
MQGRKTAKGPNNRTVYRPWLGQDYLLYRNEQNQEFLLAKPARVDKAKGGRSTKKPGDGGIL